MTRELTLFLAAIALCVSSGCGKPDSAAVPKSAGAGSLSLAVIPKGTTHVFWKSIEAGAQEAGEELGVEIIWKGPLLENDRAQQIAIVEQFVAQGVSGIVVAPLDDVALRRPVLDAQARGIPVVICDSALKGEAGKDFVSFVATNNKAGGTRAGEQLAQLLGGKGKVVLLRYQEGSASTVEREAGFQEALAKHPDIQLLVDNRYAGPTAGDAKKAALEMFDKIREADGIFCSNESATFGMLLALRQNDLAGKVKFVGFDASPPLLDALKKGEIDALIAQDPKTMGHEAVKVLVEHLRGKKVPTYVNSGAKLITRENLDDPQVKKFLRLE